MNIYLMGMIISMIIYMGVGVVVNRKLKSANDFYVAEGNAPTGLIVGSLIASYIGVGAFMGDAGETYSGFFMGLCIIVVMKAVGPVYGSVFFGRYLRRSNSVTLPEFFGRRFNSKAVQKISALIAIIAMTVYFLSVTQGMGTLMHLVTGAPYIVCVAMVLVTVTVLTILSGSKGVLLTDTIMFAVFSAISLIALAFIVKAGGGWFSGIEELANFEAKPDLLSWTNNLDYLYPSGMENLIWAIGYGIVWSAISSIAPWQSSRYLMARNEGVCIRSGSYAAIFLFLIEFVVIMAGVFVNASNPNEEPSHAIIWAAMNIMPELVGVILLTGILAAGLSSSTTFLSLIGSFFSVDILGTEKDAKGVMWARIFILIDAVIIFLVAYFNPPSLFWIMFFGATVVACCWLPMAFASIWSKRVTAFGASLSMLLGLVGCFGTKLYYVFAEITPPLLLDNAFVGIFLGIVGLIIGSAVTKVTPEEEAYRVMLHQIPEKENNIGELKRSLRYTKNSIWLGVVIAIILIVFWAAPTMQAMG